LENITKSGLRDVQQWSNGRAEKHMSIYKEAAHGTFVYTTKSLVQPLLMVDNSSPFLL